MHSQLQRWEILKSEKRSWRQPISFIMLWKLTDGSPSSMTIVKKDKYNHHQCYKETTGLTMAKAVNWINRAEIFYQPSTVNLQSLLIKAAVLCLTDATGHWDTLQCLSYTMQNFCASIIIHSTYPDWKLWPVVDGWLVVVAEKLNPLAGYHQFSGILHFPVEFVFLTIFFSFASSIYKSPIRWSRVQDFLYNQSQ